MNLVRDILNEIKWRKGYDLSKVEIWYIHRGAPNNTRILRGDEIKSIGKTFIETDDAMIPHHRVFKIVYNGRNLFDRKKIE